MPDGAVVGYHEILWFITVTALWFIVMYPFPWDWPKRRKRLTILRILMNTKKGWIFEFIWFMGNVFIFLTVYFSMTDRDLNHVHRLDVYRSVNIMWVVFITLSKWWPAVMFTYDSPRVSGLMLFFIFIILLFTLVVHIWQHMWVTVITGSAVLTLYSYVAWINFKAAALWPEQKIREILENEPKEFEISPDQMLGAGEPAKTNMLVVAAGKTLNDVVGHADSATEIFESQGSRSLGSENMLKSQMSSSLRDQSYYNGGMMAAKQAHNMHLPNGYQKPIGQQQYSHTINIGHSRQHVDQNSMQQTHIGGDNNSSHVAGIPQKRPAGGRHDQDRDAPLW